MTVRRAAMGVAGAVALIAFTYAVTASPGRTLVPSTGSSPLIAVACPSLMDVATSGLDDTMPYQCTTAVVSRFIATAGLTVAGSFIAAVAALVVSFRRSRR